METEGEERAGNEVLGSIFSFARALAYPAKSQKAMAADAKLRESAAKKA